MNGNSIFARAGKAGIVCAFIFLAGCHELTGGGWIPGANGGKANFGFVAKCADSIDPDFGDLPYFYEGQFQYQDRLAGVRFHAAMEGSLGFIGFGNCDDVGDLGEADPEFTISGACESRPGKVGGSFMVTFLDDGGAAGAMAGRKMIVQTPNPFIPPEFTAPCADNGLPYYNEGYIGGGTLKSHGH